MIVFNSTYFYLIVVYAHMKIFLLYMRKISFIFLLIIIDGSAKVTQKSVFSHIQLF